MERVITMVHGKNTVYIFTICTAFSISEHGLEININESTILIFDYIKGLESMDRTGGGITSTILTKVLF